MTRFDLHRVPHALLLFTSMLLIAFMAAIEFYQGPMQLPQYREKVLAATIMKNGIELIRRHRANLFQDMDEEIDKKHYALIGLAESPITSNAGYLNVKKGTLNPNWAAALVMMLTEAEVRSGDHVAIGMSGSFPALNIATLAAVEALGLKAILISSVASSNWGANHPDFTWLDMEKILVDDGVISSRSVAASLGGRNDRADGISKAGVSALRSAIERASIRFIKPQPLRDSIDERMAIYRDFSGGKRIAAYINVGGGVASIGPQNKRLFLPGLNKSLPADQEPADGVISRFGTLGTPIIHISHIEKIAERYGLSSGSNPSPDIGKGPIYEAMRYDKTMALALLTTFSILMHALVRRWRLSL